MKRLALIFALFPAAALSQTQEEEDKGYIAQLIEDNLSGDARDVSIIGFEGALSSKATIARLTVADSEGVWLTLEDVALDWNRSALLGGAIEVNELSATKITVARPPIPDTSVDLPAAEATPFALPELPVSINLDELRIDEIALGDAFLGEPINVSLTGSANLANGAGTANVQAIRLNERAGTFGITGGYDNATQVLDLDLDLREDPDGIIARLLDLPGKPSVDLTLDGDGPITDYTATLGLNTDGSERLSGDLRLVTTEAGQQFGLDVGGDVTPLFAPDYQDFFGPDVTLEVTGIARAEGGFDLSALDLSARNVTLSGEVSTDANGWPEKIALSGEINDRSGERVLLPLTGPKTFVQSMDLNIGYDRRQSDDWIASFDIDDLERPGMFIDNTRLNGAGTIIAGDVPAVTANFSYAAAGLTLDDVGLAEALGETISGTIRTTYQDGTPTTIERLTLEGPGIEVLADATIAGPDKGLRTESNVLLTVDTLSRFSTLVGQDLSGAADLSIISTVSPLDGFFEILMSGSTDDLQTGIAEVDAITTGAGALSLLAERDTAGTRLRNLRIGTDAGEIKATADIGGGSVDADFSVSLVDVGLVLDGVSGPANVAGQAGTFPDGSVTFDVTGAAPDIDFSARGRVVDNTDLNLSAVLRTPRLATYRPVVGQAISGGAELVLGLDAKTDGSLFQVTLNGDTDNLQTGIDQLDPLLRGAGNLRLQAARTAPENYKLSTFQITTPTADLQGAGSGDPMGPFNANLTADIADVSVVLPDLSGPVSAKVIASRDADGVISVDADATAPASTLSADATLSPEGRIAGNARADIANLAPYRRLIGQPLRGGLQATVVGTAQSDMSAFNAEITARTLDIGIGNPSVDRLLAGSGTLNAIASQDGDGLRVRNLDAETGNVTLAASLDATAAGGTGQFSARLRDVGLFTDQLSGPATATGTASRNGSSWTVNVDATGPGGIGAQVAGTVQDSGTLNLRVNGNAPLGLANDIIAPRRLSGDATFAIGVNGPPALSSVSGQVNIAGGRLAAPTFAQALEQINGRITLNGGSANVAIGANVESGGQVSVTGPVGLTGSQQADIALTLSDVILRDPTLYDSSVGGTITLRGPLAGGARIAGTLTLGPSEIQVPSSSLSSLGELPNVVHFGEGAPVRRTLNRADVNATAGTGRPSRASSGPVYPIDININAPSRIFIRGRGLDAELGGRLNLGGTTGNVIPVGQFDLIRGRIDILQQRFELDEGSASLQGDFEPFVRLVARTETRTGTIVSIIVEGPASEPEVTFSSVPELPQDEVLAQLIFGRDLSEISPLQAVQLAAAVSTLAGRGGGGLVDDFRQNIGLDDLDVTTDEDGNAAVRAGAYISENVYTDVTVSSDGSTEVNINLDITDEITAKGTAGADGETSIGIFFERDY